MQNTRRTTCGLIRVPDRSIFPGFHEIRPIMAGNEHVALILERAPKKLFLGDPKKLDFPHEEVVTLARRYTLEVYLPTLLYGIVMDGWLSCHAEHEASSSSSKVSMFRPDRTRIANDLIRDPLLFHPQIRRSQIVFIRVKVTPWQLRQSSTSSLGTKLCGDLGRIQSRTSWKRYLKSYLNRVNF